MESNQADSMPMIRQMPPCFAVFELIALVVAKIVFEVILAEWT